MRSIWIAIVLTGCLVGSTAGNVINVPSAQPTIQAGINAAGPGDTVLVGPGTYTGPSNRNLDFGGKNIVLRSSAGAPTTIIDCQDLARGMRFHTGETSAAIVQGFTIRNGLASGTFGGGILVESGARPTIRNCRFQSNHANTGGGVFVSSGITLIDCDFQSNSADNNGGAAYGETANLQATRCSFAQNTAGIGAGVSVNFGATATLTDCTFAENDPANLGGGFHSSASAVSLFRCSFVGNTGKHGAGAYLLEGTASVDSCTFTTNTATFTGGGMHADQVGPFTVSGCSFAANTTLEASNQFGRGGGGLYIDADDVSGYELSDCVFNNNRALGGAAAGGGGFQSFNDSNSLISNCTFVNNQSDGIGGGAWCSARVHGCVFEGNQSEGSGGGLIGGGELIDCRFTDNHAITDHGGGCRFTGANIGSHVVRCEFTQNSAGGSGGGLYWAGPTPMTLEDSQFLDNSALEGGGLFAYCFQPMSITGCTFVSNVAGALGGGLKLMGTTPAPQVAISSSTWVGNGAPTGGGLNLTKPVEIANTIVAFGTQGEAIACSGDGIGVMSCTDIFGNAGGNWTACISDQLGINGNFSLDPRFCNVGGRDFALAQSSPCTAANAPAGCGLIGAYPMGCTTPIGIADAGAPAVAPLLRVTPNPLRGSGMIEWSGLAGRETEVRLYDVAGRIVARRVERGAGGGIAWTALVRAGGVPSGVYFLEVGEGRAVDARVRLVVVR